MNPGLTNSHRASNPGILWGCRKSPVASCAVPLRKRVSGKVTHSGAISTRVVSRALVVQPRVVGGERWLNRLAYGERFGT